MFDSTTRYSYRGVFNIHINLKGIIMPIQTNDIDTEITNIQLKINAGEQKITKAIKSLEKLRNNQLKLVNKQKQLQAAKFNISKFNKAG